MPPRSNEDLRQQAAQGVAEVIQKGMGFLLSREGRYGVPECLHFACNVALAALTPVAPFLAHRPVLSREEAKTMGPKELVKLINPDTMLFAALISARMLGGVHLDPENDRVRDGKDETAVSQELSFGPEVLAMALEDWKKLTERKPEGILDKNILAAIADVTKDSTMPFDELLEKRRKASKSPSSRTLQ